MGLFLLALVIVGGVWWFYGREGKVLLPQIDLQPHLAHLDRVKPHLATVRSNWRDWLRLRGRNSDLGQRLAAWAGEAQARGQVQDGRLVSWLEGRPAGERTAFAGRVATFCRSSGFELSWLLDGKAAGPAGAAVERVALTGALALWEAGDVQPFVSFLRWQLSPESERAFEDRVYRRLVSSGLAATPAELLLASEKERRGHVRQAIAQAAQNTEQFVTILRGVADEPAAVLKTKGRGRRAVAVEAVETAAV